ncbi:MAG: hypothetical protein GVY10_05590 [Verrucomicrobia bacterium]|jgi:uncharacterized iron-regulated membrane protein|nr:hypothetical protein [Verrucomicrobiota bacterium]
MTAERKEAPAGEKGLSARLRRLHRWLWWWHFWPGILLAPVIVLASVTGALYVWKGEAEGWLYRHEMRVAPGAERVSLDRMAASVREAVPGDLFSIEWSGEETQPAKAYVQEAGSGRTVLVWIQPFTGEVAGWRYRDEMLFSQIRDLHRFLWSGRLLGNVLPGRLLVEAATSWTILLTLSGVLLWWNGSRARPRQWKLVQRARPYILWRNWHSVPAVWLSVPLVLILVTGLAFSKGAGSLWTGAGALSGTFPEAYVDHPTVSPETRWLPYETLLRKASKASDPQAFSLILYGESERVPLVLRGNYENRPWELRARWLRPDTGEMLSETSWAAMHPYAKGYIASYSVHVGWIGGFWTKLLATFLCLLLVFLVISGLAMWWIRRPSGKSGFPKKTRIALPWWLLTGNAAMGLLLPTVGLSLLVVFLGGLCLPARKPPAGAP